MLVVTSVDRPGSTGPQPPVLRPEPRCTWPASWGCPTSQRSSAPARGTQVLGHAHPNRVSAGPLTQGCDLGCWPTARRRWRLVPSPRSLAGRLARLSCPRSRHMLNSRLFGGLGMVNRHRGSCDVNRCQERRTAGPANYLSSSPRTPAHSSCGDSSQNPGGPPRGVHTARRSGRNGRAGQRPR